MKSWRFETLMPAARAVYREIEAELRVTLWREMRVRRFFADEQERALDILQFKLDVLCTMLDTMQLAYGIGPDAGPDAAKD